VFSPHPFTHAVVFFSSVYYYHFRDGSHRVSAPAEATVWHTSRRPPPPLGGSIITTITTTTTTTTTITTTSGTTGYYRVSTLLQLRPLAGACVARGCVR